MTEKELSVKQNMLWNSVGSLTNLGCQWLMTVLVVRVAGGYSEAGTFSLAMSVYGIFSPIAQYRMYTYQISDVRKENSPGEYLSFRVLTCGIALALCMAYSLATCSSDAWLAIFLYGLYKSVALAIDVFHACDQTHHRMDYIGKSLAMQGFATLSVFLAALSVFENLEVSLLCMTAVLIVIGLFYDRPRTCGLEPVHFGISRSKAATLFKVCFVVVIAGVVASATPSLPRQYLAFAMGNEMLGIYASVAAPVAVIQMGASYIYNPLLGYFSERYYDGDRSGFVNLLIKSTAGIALVGVICAIALAFLGESLLAFAYGDSIRSYAYLLQPLIAFAVLTGYLWFINDLLICLRSFKGTFAGCIVAFIVAVGTMIPMVNLFGPNGVTVAGLLSDVSGIAVMIVVLVGKLRGMKI